LTIALCLDVHNYKQLSTFAVIKKTSCGSNDAWLCRCPQRATQEEPKGQRILLSSLQAPSRGRLLKNDCLITFYGIVFSPQNKKRMKERLNYYLFGFCFI
jgi:hypothetical protein